MDTSDTQAIRIMVLGDSGVGKSRLVRYLTALGGATPVTREGTTVGAALEAVVMQSPRGSKRVVEFMEVGGNRGFAAAARAPLFANAAAAMILYAEDNEASRQSVVHWHRELVDNAGSSVPFTVVGTAFGGAGQSPTGTNANTSGSGSSGPATKPPQWVPAVIAAPLEATAGFITAVALLVLSFVLFGPSNTVIPWQSVPADRALDAVENAARTAHRGLVSGVNIASAAAFRDTCEGVVEFVTSVGGAASPSV